MYVCVGRWWAANKFIINHCHLLQIQELFCIIPHWALNGALEDLLRQYKGAISTLPYIIESKYGTHKQLNSHNLVRSGPDSKIAMFLGSD